MSEQRTAEDACSVTGKPCNWVSDDETDEHGVLIAWDLFCTDCMRFRDWSKVEFAPLPPEVAALLAEHPTWSIEDAERAPPPPTGRTA